jgi:hypothetical protein
MLKETGTPIILSFLIYFFLTEYKKGKKIYKEIFKYSIPLWLIVIFLILQKLTAGKFIGIFTHEVDIYKHTPEEILNDFVSIFKWIFIYQYRYIFSLIIALNLIFNRKTFFRKELLLFVLIFVLVALPFSYFYFLPRYLLPVIPYLYIAASWSLVSLIKSVKLQTSFSLGLTTLLIFSLSGSPSYGNNEWNMKYLGMVGMYKSVCKYVEREFPNSSILTIFPYSTSLREPYLGYVSKGLNSISFDKVIDEKNCDLILFSDPAVEERELKLKEYVKKKGMILVMKAKEEGIISKLYAKNSLLMANKVK